jgi:hypothetical protein
MKFLNFYSSFLLAAILLTTSCTQEEKWIQLFNGENLDGWDIKFTGYELNNNYLNTFKVEDGLLKVSYENWDSFNNVFGHIYYNEEFSNYKLRVEYRFSGEQCPGGLPWAWRNNGVMIHSQSAQSLGLDQNFPISLEVQLLGGDGEKERPNANLCTPGTIVEIDGAPVEAHCLSSKSKTYHGDEWVTLEIIVYSDSIIHHVLEGDTVLSYSNPKMWEGSVRNYNEDVFIPGKPLKSGYIALQAESHPTEFRKIEILVLER